MMRRALGLLALLIGLLASRAGFAEEISAADASAILAAVQSQLDAFADDDAAKAFDLATPATRALLGTPDRFLKLIKDQYPPIYRNRSVQFSTPEMIEGHALIMARLTDRENIVWIAIYEMEQEADGSWKIDGCSLFETTSVSI
jgi:hypothetical protein